jgi:hypothetical protein
LDRIIELVKPGGWLLVEDTEHYLEGNIGPGIKKFYDVYHSYMKPRGVDPMVGRLLEPTLKESGKFSAVDVRKVFASFWRNDGSMPKLLSGLY